MVFRNENRKSKNGTSRNAEQDAMGNQLRKYVLPCYENPNCVDSHANCTYWMFFFLNNQCLQFYVRRRSICRWLSDTCAARMICSVRLVRKTCWGYRLYPSEGSPVGFGSVQLCRFVEKLQGRFVTRSREAIPMNFHHLLESMALYSEPDRVFRESVLSHAREGAP